MLKGDLNMKLFYAVVLSTFLFSTSSHAVLTDIECDEIWEKYTSIVFKYKKNKDDINVYNAGVSELDEYADSYRDMIRKLDIQYTIEDIRENFEKYGVLLLRPLKGIKLLLGCGNKPVCPYLAAQPYHEHDEYDTVNPEISTNPGLIAAFGANDLSEILPNTYEELAFEAFTPEKTQGFLGAFQHHCTHVKDIFDIDNPYEKNEPLRKDRLNSIDEIFFPDNYDEWSESSDDDKAGSPHDSDEEFLSTPWGIDYSEVYPDDLSTIANDSLAQSDSL